ncbi:MAG: M3 family metallopeptidase [Duganella sp.]
MTMHDSEAPVCSLEHLFADHAAWQAALSALQQHLADSPATPPADAGALHHWLQQLDALQRQYGRLSTWSGVQGFVDTRAALPQQLGAQLRAPGAALGKRVAALQALLLATPEDQWVAWLAAAPALQAYHGRYRQLRAGRAHALAPEVEQALAALDSTLQLPLQLYRRIKAGDLQFDDVYDSSGQAWPFSLTQYEKRFETSADGQLRQAAFAAYNNGVQRHRHAFAAAYGGEVTRQVSLARLRGFDSTVDFLCWLQGIDSRFLASQRAMLNAGLAPLMRRFIEVKRRLLGAPSLAYHDLKAVPPQVQLRVSLAEARSAIVAASGALGADYAAVVEQAFEQRWIEHGQQPHKADSSGCASPFGPHPYVLMTWSGSARDMFLLAHELGHAVHFHWSASHQSAWNAAPLRYFIEAPSTLNELLLAEHLLRSSDARIQLAAVFELLSSYYHNFVTHHLESEFQLRVYQAADAGQLPGADMLQQLKRDVLRDFWGDQGAHIAIDDSAGLAWLRQHHYYMGLYPYTYAAGQSIATLFHQRLQSAPDAAHDWCAALRQGSAVPAEELLQQMGLDMAAPSAFSSVLAHIEHLVATFEQLAQPHFNNGAPS